MNILTLPIDKLKPYENNPRHNIDRWEQYTGKEAILLKSGDA